MVAKKKPQNQGEGQHCAGFKFTETAKWPRKLIWAKNSSSSRFLLTSYDDHLLNSYTAKVH